MFSPPSPASDRRWPIWQLVCWLMVMLGSTGMVTAAAPAVETEVKAVYVYNFASFVSWPETSAGEAQQPFLICALGENQVTKLLTQVIEGEQVYGRPMQFRSIHNAADAVACQILFLASRDMTTTTQALRAVQTLPVLTVGEQAGFARDGGHIELSLRGNRIHPIINRHTVERSQLRISAKLYRLATVLEDQEPTER